jgi:transcriptional regulator with XRE-family HTH domain
MEPNKRRSPIEVQALRLLRARLAGEGAKVRAARQRRKLTQKGLGQRAGLSQQTISQLERGDGATLSLASWQRVALVLALHLDLRLGRDSLEGPRDGGHLALQELVLRLARARPAVRRFELPNRGSDPSRWSDVAVIDHANRRIELYECVNVFADIGAAVRSSDRKVADAEGVAATVSGGEAYAVHACWVVRDSRRNRVLVARYPELFASRFAGSSRRWLRTLVTGAQPPMQRGLIWCDVRVTRVFAWRRAKIGA